jgi:large subunit ribosomal protein L4
VIFGPKPRKYKLNLSVKARRLALRSAVLAKVADTVAVDSFGLDKPSTKALVAFIATLKLEGRILLVVKDAEENLYLSARNIKNVKLVQAGNLSVKDLLTADKVVATEDALRHIEEVFKA